MNSKNRIVNIKKLHALIRAIYIDIKLQDRVSQCLRQCAKLCLKCCLCLCKVDCCCYRGNTVNLFQLFIGNQPAEVHYHTGHFPTSALS